MNPPPAPPLWCPQAAPPAVVPQAGPAVVPCAVLPRPNRPPHCPRGRPSGALSWRPTCGAPKGRPPPLRCPQLRYPLAGRQSPPMAYPLWVPQLVPLLRCPLFPRWFQSSSSNSLQYEKTLSHKEQIPNAKIRRTHFGSLCYGKPTPQERNIINLTTCSIATAAAQGSMGPAAANSVKLPLLPV